MSSSSLSFSQWITSSLIPQFERVESLRKTVDPEREPYKSKYEALELLAGLIKDLQQIPDEQKTDRYWLTLAIVHFECSSIQMDTDDLASAEKSLKECVEILGNHLDLGLIVESYQFDEGDHFRTNVVQPEPEIRLAFTLLLIIFYNQLAFLKFSKLYMESSIPYLKEAEKLYYEWKKQDPQPYQVEHDDLIKLDPAVQTMAEIVQNLKSKPVNKEKIQKGHIMTIYYLAQVLEQIGEHAESARYCHQTLRLNYPYLGSDDFYIDHIEWALNAATLSQYFANNDQYNVARHMIACARKVHAETDAKKKVEEEERFRKAAADIDRIEVKYCLMLLMESTTLKQQGKLETYPEPDTQFKAYLLNDEKVAQLENQLPTFPVRDYEQAKKVFRHAIAAIERAKTFFTKNERCSDYIDCTFDHSQIYGAIIPYDPEIENRCKMVKRRIDLLEGVLKEINPQYFLQHCRKLFYELGDLHSQQVALKMLQHEINYGKNKKQASASDEAKTDNAPDVKLDAEKNMHAIKKINLLAAKCILNYHNFLSSFEYLNSDAKTRGKFINATIDKIQMYPLPKRIEEDDYVQPILTAYLAIGQMYTKLVTALPEERIRNWRICEKYYQEIKSYLERNPDHRDKYFKDFSQQMDEMLRLIPGKIQSIITQSVH